MLLKPDYPKPTTQENLEIFFEKCWRDDTIQWNVAAGDVLT
jgi:hypothetical protein